MVGSLAVLWGRAWCVVSCIVDNCVGYPEFRDFGVFDLCRFGAICFDFV